LLSGLFGSGKRESKTYFFNQLSVEQTIIKQELESVMAANVASNKISEKIKTPSQSIELKCFVCGKMAGCRTCSFSNICDRSSVP
jgi:hypothetical protein